MWPMRLAVIFCVTALMSAAAAAQEHVEYPWCAVYSNDFGGTNCGFSTIEQCRATVSGIGGFCEPNPFYKPRQPIRRDQSPRRQSDYPGIMAQTPQAFP